jgi:hypothetical protein
MALMIRGVEPRSVFGLIGMDENSPTFALGWILERSPAFRALFIEGVLGEGLDVAEVLITLQKHAEDGGYTDCEIHGGGEGLASMPSSRRSDGGTSRPPSSSAAIIPAWRRGARTGDGW